MKAKFNVNISRVLPLAVALFMLSTVVASIIQPKSASAAQLTSRKLTLSSSANGNVSTDLAGNTVAKGSGGNGAFARHTFDFTIPGAASTVQSIEFEYCSNSPIFSDSCTAPTGMDASTVASIAGQSGLTGFALGTGGNAPTANRIRIDRTNATNVSSNTTVQFYFGTGAGTDWIKNPTTDNSTFFVKIKVYTGTGYSGSRDFGAVASSTAQQIDITAKVREKLNFSVGSTYVAPGGTCTAFSDTGALALGDVNGVLDSATQYDNFSWFRVSTNSVNGAKVYYSGDTLKDGANDINALTSEGTTAAGSEQFGLALDSGEAGYSFTHLTANSNYDEGNGSLGTAKFNYATGSVTTPVEIASSTGIVGCDTGSVRYVGNIATNTPAGVYTTTVTYIAVPTF